MPPQIPTSNTQDINVRCKRKQDPKRTYTKKLDTYSLTQIMEMRRAKWLEKLAHMPSTRNPRKLFVTWVHAPRPIGRPKQTIRHSYANTLEENLGYKGDSSYNAWMNDAKNPATWKQQVERTLKLKPGTYKLANLNGNTGQKK